MLTIEQAEDLVARTLAAIDRGPRAWCTDDVRAADRERVASDLAGLRLLDADESADYAIWYPLRGLFADGLTRTARLYGVTP